MKHIFKTLVVVSSNILVFAACSNTPREKSFSRDAVPMNASGGTLSPKTATGTLSVNEIQGILQMREEEKLAFDVYFALEQKWGQQIFRNIMAAENTHMSSMLRLVQEYGLEDPVKDAPRGVFSNTGLQKLYGELLEKGLRSPSDAILVGASIEDLDIHDLENLIASTSQSRIQAVYSTLERGSKNHMRAFVGQLKSFGMTYTPVHISQEIFDSIVR